MQIVNLNEDVVPCSKCHINLSVLGSFTHIGVKENTALKKDEICRCNKCGMEFILHYEFFDKEGHVNSFVFSGDINDPEYNWQDQLTEEQKIAIGDHLKTCALCNKKLIDEVASDAWLASLVHRIKK
jgi:uncharacterized protein with PIN domain